MAHFSSSSNSSDKKVGMSSLGKPSNPVRVPPSRVLGRSKIPTPASAPPVQDNPLANLPAPKSLLAKGADTISWLAKTVLKFLWKLPGNLWFYTFNATERKALFQNIQDTIKHEVNHYWMGTKLLWADIRTSRDLLNKTLGGSSLTRRERRQLLRTVSDLFRLVPFSMFIIIPFMEFALPFALRIFPNLLPSTFQDSLKAEESMKRELQSRIAMAQFFQETLEELAKEQKRKAKIRKEELREAGVDLDGDGDDTIDKQEDSAVAMLEFLEKARNGEMIPPDVIIKYANYFKDDLHIDNMPRMQLINMCKYMGIHPYGSDAFLRFQLRHKIRVLREDDQRILWEGIDSLTKMELREACQERGMRSTGLSKDAYKDVLQQWLDLSVSKNVPISLLVMSRSFFLREDMFQRKKPAGEGADEADKNLTGLADAISGLDKEVLNEIILEVATDEEKQSDPTIRKLKLEVVAQQNELIREEEAAREAAAKKKESESKKEAVAAAAEAEPAIDEHTISQDGPPDVTGASAKDAQQVSEPDKSPTDETPVVPSSDETEQAIDDEKREISAKDLDALRELLRDDPVEKEREELEKIKAAMNSKEETPEAATSLGEGSSPDVIDSSTTIAEEIPKAEPHTAAHPGDVGTPEKTIVDIDSSGEVSIATEPSSLEPETDEDPVVKGLKKRLQSMVGRIEVQLSQAQDRIGDKLKMLDKDGDGILSKEEVANVLQEVFKRKISFEQAMEIAAEIDDNHDGIFTVEELLEWIDQTKLVKFVEEGRDHEMDRMMEKSQATEQQPKDDFVAAEVPEKSSPAKN